jgi:hypothetical protein
MGRALATAAFLLVGIGTARAEGDGDRGANDTTTVAAAGDDTTVATGDDTTTVAAADDGPPGGTEPAPPPSGAADAGRPADKGAIGIGLIIGEPTGITAKLYISDDQAIQAAVGSAFIGGGLQAHGDFVWHPWILQDRSSFVLPVYLGPGIRFIDYYGGRSGSSSTSHFAVGVRGVIGMLFDFKDVPLDVFVEVAGVLEYDFTKHGGAALNAGAGVRYYF